MTEQNVPQGDSSSCGNQAPDMPYGSSDLDRCRAELEAEMASQLYGMVSSLKNMVNPVTHVSSFLSNYVGLADRIPEGIEAMVIGTRKGKRNFENGLLGKLKLSGIINVRQWEDAVAYYRNLFDTMPELVLQSGPSIGAPDNSFLEKVSESAEMVAPLLNCHVTLAGNRVQYTDHEVYADGELGVVPVNVADQVKRWLFPCISSRMLCYPHKSLFFNGHRLMHEKRKCTPIVSDVDEWFSSLNVRMVLPEIALFAIVIPQLITNAFKHSPEAGDINVNLSADEAARTPGCQKLSIRVENDVLDAGTLDAALSKSVSWGGLEQVPNILALHLGMEKKAVASVFRNEYDAFVAKWVTELTFSCQQYNETVQQQIRADLAMAHATGLTRG